MEWPVTLYSVSMFWEFEVFYKIYHFFFGPKEPIMLAATKTASDFSSFCNWFHRWLITFCGGGFELKTFGPSILTLSSLLSALYDAVMAGDEGIGVTTKKINGSYAF